MSGDRSIPVPQHVHVAICRFHGPFVVKVLAKDAQRGTCGDCGIGEYEGTVRVERFVPESRKLRFRR